VRRGEQRRQFRASPGVARTELAARGRLRPLAGTRVCRSSSVPRAATAGPPRHLTRRRTETARNFTRENAMGIWEDA
jgi:hypothetical protein